MHVLAKRNVTAKRNVNAKLNVTAKRNMTAKRNVNAKPTPNVAGKRNVAGRSVNTIIKSSVTGSLLILSGYFPGVSVTLGNAGTNAAYNIRESKNYL